MLAHLRRALEKWDIWMSHKEGAFATGRSILVVCENCCIVPDTVNRQIAILHLLYLGVTLNERT